MKKYRSIAAISALAFITAALLCGCAGQNNDAPETDTSVQSTAASSAEHTIIWETETETESETEISSEYLLSSELSSESSTSAETTVSISETVTSSETTVQSSVTTISDVSRGTITETAVTTQAITTVGTTETSATVPVTSVQETTSQSISESTVFVESPSTSMTVEDKKVPKSSDDYIADESVVTIPIETEAITEEAAPVKKQSLDVDYSEYFSESLFVGDSICSGLKIYNGLLPTENVAARINVSTWGLHKYTFQYKTNSADELDAHSIVELYQPKDIYIWMGMNDLYVVSKEKYAQNMCDLAQQFLKLSNESRVHIVSISPMCSWHNWNVELDGNNVVNEFNEYCEEYCSTKPYVDYINIHDILTNSEGFLDDNNTGGDGIHLSASAYKLVLDEIIRSNENID